jgi:Protein of unknown function (DUF5818)
MKLRVSILICIVSISVLALASAVALQTTQSSSAAQASPTGTHKAASGQRTVTGCVAREGEGFVLKTDEGTYEFDTARDLSAWVGKKVRLTGRWSASGVTTTAPIKSATAAASAPEAPAEKKTGTPKSFTGDLHLHITGDVIGDCAEQK